ncbi:OpgC domain-containing protein [Rhabdaerophilum sp. SD176]|uniref:OpgC family protein n=1 Tax=Rhabdaerophilum sp. SD176 TaxID=2983548 RepID=UPI0024DFE17A|nr:OpgC domain-containing protein [Rhabdaerophilum sp. SD176]
MTPSILDPGQRDVRLDFFRGLAMFIIFIAHMPGNSWFLFIPARFGFSSAGELFVFCSGLASAYAFGRVFERKGALAGLQRVAFRIWQVYWAHIGLALVMITLSLAAARLTGIDYARQLGLDWFLAQPADGLMGLVSLGFTPAFLDILPMYLVLLAMLPAMALLGRLSHWLPLGLMAGLWLLVQATGFNLPGGQSPGMVWFFNPLAWQAMFFTGFAFGMGWLKAPALERGWLFRLCLVFLIVSVPLNFWAFTENVAVLGAIHDALVPQDGKTNLVLPLYLHFLASAYVVLVLVEPYRNRLHRAAPIVLVGQQALATFMAGIVLAWLGGMVLDATGRGVMATALANLAGFAGLLAVAALARRYKGGDGKAARQKAEPRDAARPVPPAAYPHPAE